MKWLLSAIHQLYEVIQKQCCSNTMNSSRSCFFTIKSWRRRHAHWLKSTMIRWSTRRWSLTIWADMRSATSHTCRIHLKCRLSKRWSLVDRITRWSSNLVKWLITYGIPSKSSSIGSKAKSPTSKLCEKRSFPARTWFRCVRKLGKRRRKHKKNCSLVLMARQHSRHSSSQAMRLGSINKIYRDKSRSLRTQRRVMKSLILS